MATPGTFKDTPVEKVINTLNETHTKAEAAHKLKTTPQTLDYYIKAKNIDYRCEYFVAKVITTSAQNPTQGE